ncbi:hypothetical protein J2Y69_002984 [Microbacterium resistens]|uniref:Uncharacterized protein n=1 Tax=Microbacterium resistens TaxID=156977 RepID=A0ABU1SGF4_9MICO|nr:hypothetical protein [Microbacterium resistens]MDR6868368.1 hypothetical protein [Microbacterium resistens]
MAEVSRRSVVKGAAWSVPVIAAAVAVPTATASPEVIPWNLQVEGSCSGLIGITSGGGFILTNTGSEPIPGGTVFAWTEQYDVTGELIWRSLSKSWVDNDTGLTWWDRSSDGFTFSRWSSWTSDDPWWAVIKTDRKSRTVTYVVPAEGFAPGARVSTGWQTALMHSTFSAKFVFTSGNGGAITGDESVEFRPNLIVGCNVQDPKSLSDEELAVLAPDLSAEELETLKQEIARQTP